MIQTTKQKSKTTPTELPPGWEFQKGLVNGHQAINRKAKLQTHILSKREYAIESAYEIEAAEKDGLLGLSGNGLAFRSPEANNGGTPFPTGYSQEEINRMADHCAAQKILEGKPVKICYVLNEPHVITCAMGSGDVKNWQSVDAWPILPLENVGEENSKTYSQASDEYYAGDISDPDNVFSYKGMRINCGSAKKPDWWVIVGPETAFKVKPKSNQAEAKGAVKDKAAPRKNHKCTHDIPVEVCGFGCQELPKYQEYLSQFELSIDRARLHEDAVARWRRESRLLPLSPKCVCGEPESAHDGPGGVCGLADCDCVQFRSAAELPSGTDLVKQFFTSVSCGECDGQNGHLSSCSRYAPAANGHHPQMLRMIPVDLIDPSPTNPRKYFDPDKLRELASSIIEHDLIEPILVRPIGERYQLVVGERRFRAVRDHTALTKIEAKVADLGDKAVLEIQFIENLQRSDLSALEEAEGYQALLALKDDDDKPVYTSATLAEKLSKSKSYLYGRLKLCNLPVPAMEALAKGDLPATIGELIGRLPSMELREKFWEDWFDEYGKDDFEMPSFREIKLDIERNYTRELKSAPFSRTDAKLLPEAGACKGCPKMTGNNRDEFPDSRADICTDVRCYDRKLKAQFERQVEKLKGNGARVLSEEESAKMFNVAGDSAWLRHEAQQKYFKLEDKPWEDKERRSFKQLLDGHLEPVIAVDPNGKPHYLAPKEEAARVLKEEHGIRLGGSSGGDYKKRQAENRKKVEVRKQVTSEALSHIAKAAEGRGDFLDDDELAMMRLLVATIAEETWQDVVKVVAKRREIQQDERYSHPFAKLIPQMDSGEVLGLLVELTLARQMLHWATSGYASDLSPRAKEILKFFGFDMKAAEKRIKEEIAASKRAKPKAKAKANAAV